MAAWHWISFILFVFVQNVKTKVYLMDPKLLQSMLPTYNSSEEISSEFIESKENSEVNNKADLSDEYDRRYEEYYGSGEKDVPIMRTSYVKVNVEEVKHLGHSMKAKSEKVNSQHQKRLAELMAYLETHMMSTLYFHKEMQRILEQRTVKDDLRKMVTFLEHEPDMKAKVLSCYHKHRAELAKQKDIWRHPTNDLVIDYVHEY